MNKSVFKSAWMPEKEFALFILPLILSGVFQQLYSPINAALISRCRSVEAVAVIGACGFISTLQGFLFGGIAAGFGIFLCDCAGRADPDELKKGLTASLLACLALTAAGIVLALFVRPILGLLNVKDELLTEAIPYASVIFLGSGAFVLKNVMIWLLQAKKKTGHSGAVTAVSVVTQTAITVLLIGVFRLPVWASAAAVICNNLLISGMIALLLRRACPGEIFLCKPSRIGQECWIRLIQSGISKSLMKTFSAFSSFFTARLLNTCAVEQISGYTFAMTVSNIPQVVIGAYGTCAAILWAQWKGQSRQDLLKKEVSRLLRHAVLMAGVMYVLAAIFGRFAVAAVSGSDNAVVLETGYKTLLFSSLGFFGLAFYTVGHQGLQAIGRYRIQPVLGIADMLMSALAVYGFGKALGIYTMSLSIILSWTVCGTIALIAIRKSVSSAKSV